MHCHRLLPALILLWSGLCLPPSQAQTVERNPYDAPEAWLCRPDRADLCSAEQTVTRLAEDGSRTLQVLKPRTDAAIDCFYVYPTISQDPNPHSTLQAGPGERRAVSQQFAAFASVCRPFAPMYRQITLAGLRAVMTGQSAGVDTELPIRDVRAAWQHYLAKDNQGRGVVLIGHSQGSRMLIELLKRDVEGTPAQQRLVSALIIGLNVMVPSAQGTGGTFSSLPVCRTSADTGCVVTYATFRESAPPPGNARFGRSHNPASEVACTDPVLLSRQPLRSMLPRETNLLGQSVLQGDWALGLEGVTTPFVDLPGLVRASCVKDGAAHYLALGLNPGTQAKRPTQVPGDIVVNERTLDDWGLHLIDVNIVMGNLLELVRLQGLTWLAKAR